MSKVLILGFAPLPFENPERIYGGNLRTLHILKSLLENDHHVYVIGKRIEGMPKDLPPVIHSKKQGFEYFSIDIKKIKKNIEARKEKIAF